MHPYIGGFIFILEHMGWKALFSSYLRKLHLKRYVTYQFSSSRPLIEIALKPSLHPISTTSQQKKCVAQRFVISLWYQSSGSKNQNYKLCYSKL